MASPASPLDAIITVKVHYDGVTRRSKMPLRDAAPKTLENRVRAFLHISDDDNIVIERYSDSAGTFVVLDPENQGVYKQLYRAAKAKSKLKLRVTRIPAEGTAVEPKAVTVEDAPEEQTSPFTGVAIEPATSPLENDPDTPHQCDVAGSSCPRYAICCNSCDRTTSDVHYHCSTCEDGDFDLCQSCVELGITCHGSDHWLIKRTTENGQIVTSTTETIAPKPKPKSVPEPKSEPELKMADTLPAFPSLPPWPSAEAKAALARLEQTMSKLNVSMRTCNSCVEEHPEAEFLHCQVCNDFDLCRVCFSQNSHGHHPGHGFQPAVPGTLMPDHINVKLSPGRNERHYALCDGCDKFILGIRHKCLQCPDWDYCQECMAKSSDTHPEHRFVSVYDPQQIGSPLFTAEAAPVHTGVFCDGPVCARTSYCQKQYVTGIRYKCAVCHDVDFCETCEASPENTHNKTHPLIKFKTAIRHVSVTTMGEDPTGIAMPAMGDRQPASPAPALDAIRTVVDVKPQEKATDEKTEVCDVLKEIIKEEASTPIKVEEPAFNNRDLRAVFVRDQVADGTILPPSHVFEQTWVLRNEGKVAWPAGCSVKFVSGDYMGHVDSTHPANIEELSNAAETTRCSTSVQPGDEYPFRVLLRSPPRPGKSVSYWRLTTEDGYRFGHHVWCAVNVRNLEPEASSEQEKTPELKDEKPAKTEDAETSSSQMIFPKLEKESPVASIHEEARAQQPEPIAPAASEGSEDGDDQWDMSDDNFITDDEYDILDASDEEFLEEQQKKLLKK